MLKNPKECDEDFLTNVIKLVLYALSRNSFPQDITKKVISSLENFLYQISHRISHSKEFSALNKGPMKLEIQVLYVCIDVCVYIHKYIMYIHKYIMYICLSLCMYVCMYYDTVQIQLCICS